MEIKYKKISFFIESGKVYKLQNY